MERQRVDYFVVDDDMDFRSRLVRALTRRDNSVVEADSLPRAREQLKRCLPKRAIIDLRMPGGSGLELISALLHADPAVEIVMLTGHGSVATAVEAMQLGARNYLSKPVDTEEILAAFEGVPSGRRPVEAPVASLEQVEWEHIQRVMRECDGNVTHAARLLGMHRRSLQRKLARGK